jgi:hypothetical protein
MAALRRAARYLGRGFRKTSISASRKLTIEHAKMEIKFATITGIRALPTSSVISVQEPANDTAPFVRWNSRSLRVTTRALFSFRSRQV